MKKNKLGLFALTVGSLGFLACLPYGEMKSSSLDGTFAKDTTFLVSLYGTKDSLGAEGVKNSQRKFEDELTRVIGNNFIIEKSYDAVNVIKVKANKVFENTIASIGNVYKSSINKSYRFSETFSGLRNSDEIKEGYVPFTSSSTNAEGQDVKSNENQSASTMKVPTQNKGGAGSFVAILDSGYYIEHNAFANFKDPEVIQKATDRFNYQDLDKACSNKDFTATRTKVLENVVPTTQQELNDGSLYYNLKIPFYYDYGGSSLSAANDVDVLSRVSEHGTHVASITGANGTYNGIAPNTQLALMKVFYEQLPSDDGKQPGGVYAKDEDIIEALNDCAILGVDSLNMSLGSDLDDFTDKSTSMNVLSKLTADGISCNIAAGNGGKALFKSMNTYKGWATDQVDTGILGSYAVSGDANVVASSTNPKQYYEKAIQVSYESNGKQLTSVMGYSDQVEYTPGKEDITPENQKLLKDVAKDGKIELITAGAKDSNGNYFGTSADYQKAISESNNPKLFNGKVVVADRGSNSFLDKAKAAKEAGAAGLIVVNNDPTAIEFTFGMSWSNGNQGFEVPEIPVVFVLYRDRDIIFNKCLTDKAYAKEGTASIIAEQEADNPEAFQLSDFSSDGSTSDLKINPTISAPGSSIKGATLGLANNSGYVEELNPDKYEYMNGTSMATPNYTGIVALMIGEQNFENEEARKAFMKTITMRTMSTATQYESTSYIYDKIKVEEKETTGDYVEKVLTYTPTEYNKEEDYYGTKNVAPFSPRKQGAGVVNATKALKNKVYLEGLTLKEEGGKFDGSFTNQGVGHAKIELKNNELVKEGKIQIGFRLHNPEKKAVKYNVKMNILAPELSVYHNHDNQLANYVAKDAVYEGAKIQTIYDKVLEKDVKLGEVELTANDVSKDFTLKPYTIKQESKDYLSNFENGTMLEGYVYLEPVGGENLDNGITNLSIPYLGFYGDYSQADATEPFDFEKEPEYSTKNVQNGQEIGLTGKDKINGKLYGSDLVNYLGKNSYAMNAIDVSSTIGVDSYANYNSTERQSAVLTNINNIGNFAKPLTTKKGEDGTYTLYVGGEESDVLYIQEFVYRSLSKETVKIINKYGETVSESYVKDIIDNSQNLFKSIISSNYIANKTLVHRGYAELPLYNSKTGTKLPDGEYKLQFTYDLIYGSKQTKNYKLVIDSKKPELLSKTIITKGDDKVLRLKFSELYIDSQTKIHVNADYTTFTWSKVNDGYLIDIPLKDAWKNGKLFVTIQDGAHNVTRFMLNESANSGGAALISSELTPGSKYSYEVTTNASTNGNIDDTYLFEATNYDGSKADLGTFEAIFTYDRKINKTLKVYGIDSKGRKHSLKYEFLDSLTVKVTSSYNKIQLLDAGIVNDSVVNEDNATIKLPTLENGQIYCDRTSGRAGDVATLYVIPSDGYMVEKVIVNGEELMADISGNYQFILRGGENTVEVIFAAK